MSFDSSPLNGVEVDVQELATTLRLLADAIEAEKAPVTAVSANETAITDGPVRETLRLTYNPPAGSDRLTDPISYVDRDGDTADERPEAEKAIDRVLRRRLLNRQGVQHL